MNVPVDPDLHKRVNVARAIKDQTLQEFVADALTARCELVEAEWDEARRAKKGAGGAGRAD